MLCAAHGGGRHAKHLLIHAMAFVNAMSSSNERSDNFSAFVSL